MRKLLTILSVLVFTACSHAAMQQVTAVLWPTNFAIHSNSLTFNSSDIRYASTNITNSATQWAVTNTAAWTASNLLAHIALHSPLGIVSYGVQKSPTNDAVIWIIAPTGSNITVVPTGSGGSNWAFVTYFTNSFNQSSNAFLPRAAMNSSAQSNSVTALVDWMNANPRAAEMVSNAATIWQQFITTRTNGQSVSNLNVRQAGTGTMIVDSQNKVVGNATLNSVVITNGQLSISGTQTVSSLVFNSNGALYVIGGTSANAVIRFLELSNYFALNFTNRAAKAIDLNRSGSIIGAEVQLRSPDTYGTNGHFRIVQDAAYTDESQTAVFKTAGSSGDEYWNFNAPGGDGGEVDFWTVPRFGDFDNSDSLAVDYITGDAPRIYVRTNAPIYHPGLRSPKIYGLATNFGAFITADLPEISGLTSGSWLYQRNPTNHGNYVIFGASSGALNMVGTTNTTGTAVKGDWFWGMNGTSYPITLLNGSSLTHAGNQMLLPNSATQLVVNPLCWMLQIYDGSRWRVLYPEDRATASTNLSFGTTVITNMPPVAFTNYDATNIWAHSEQQFAVYISGVKSNDTAVVLKPSNVMSNCVMIDWTILSNNYVNVRLINAGTNSVDLPTATYGVRVTQFQ